MNPVVAGPRSRGRFDAFRRALAAGTESEPLLSAVETDRRLHAQRVASDRSKRTHAASPDALPDGVFVLLPGVERTPYLVLGDTLLARTAAGYADRVVRSRGVKVESLTPELTVRAMRGGYVPDLHPTAHEFLDRRT